MDEKYLLAKQKESHDLFLSNRFFKKARALIIKDNKLVVLTYNREGKKKYIIPGGGVENHESVRSAVMREAREEVNMKVRILDLLCKEYYAVDADFNGEAYKSKRIAFYYMCEFVSNLDNKQIGLDGEFGEGISIELLDLDTIKKTKHYSLNSMSRKTYEKLVTYLENYFSKKASKQKTAI